MLTPTLISKLINENTHGSEIDLKAIAQALDVRVITNSGLDDLCRITLAKGDKGPTIELNPKLDKQTKFTLVVIAIAEYILSFERVAQKGITYDMFFIKNLSEEKYSYRMLLATRLAFPESVMREIDSNPTAFSEFVSTSKYLPEFVRLCSPDKSLSFVLSNFGS